jgi:hypothetical protein
MAGTGRAGAGEGAAGTEAAVVNVKDTFSSGLPATSLIADVPPVNVTV